MKQKPLLMVLVGQLVTLALVVVFLATRPDETQVAPPEDSAQHQESEAHEPSADAEPLTPVTALDGGQLAEAVDAGVAPAPVKAAQAPKPPELPELLQSFSSGNTRFIDGVTKQRDVQALRLGTSEKEQAAVAMLTCTDSRLVPELIFDQPLGTFAVVRRSGLATDEGTIKDLEESVQKLGLKTVVVLGHVGCNHHRSGALDGPGTEQQVSSAVRALRKGSRVLSRATLLRAVYSPSSGKVQWLDATAEEPEPAPAAGRR